MVLTKCKYTTGGRLPGALSQTIKAKSTYYRSQAICCCISQVTATSDKNTVLKVFQ